MKFLFLLSCFVAFTSIAVAIAGDQHVTVTGEVYTSDLTQPALGRAFRDSRGLLWGDIIAGDGGEELMPGDGKVISSNWHTAQEHCRAIGARLPTRAEFEQLYEDLGGHTYDGYFPWTDDAAQDPVLPRLIGYMFWTSTPDASGRQAATYSGSFGSIGYRSIGSLFIQARCVRSQ